MDLRNSFCGPRPSCHQIVHMRSASLQLSDCSAPKKDLKVNQLLHRSPQKHLPTAAPLQHQKSYLTALLGDSFASAGCREQWSSKGTKGAMLPVGVGTETA